MKAAERQVRGEFVAPKGKIVITAPIVLGWLQVTPLVAGFIGDLAGITQVLSYQISKAVRDGVLEAVLGVWELPSRLVGSLVKALPEIRDQ